MDAALLLLPGVGFVDYQDPRIVRTTDTVWRELAEDGLLRRYAAEDDGLPGREGVFLACSFWLIAWPARAGWTQPMRCSVGPSLRATTWGCSRRSMTPVPGR
jgi:GH15 family glucan-1,4-alpha-glucosidase